MATYIKEQIWIDELDDARAVIHANVDNPSIFQDSPILRESTVVMATIGDNLRAAVIPATSTVPVDEEPEGILTGGEPVGGSNEAEGTPGTATHDASGMTGSGTGTS